MTFKLASGMMNEVNRSRHTGVCLEGYSPPVGWNAQRVRYEKCGVQSHCRRVAAFIGTRRFGNITPAVGGPPKRWNSKLADVPEHDSAGKYRGVNYVDFGVGTERGRASVNRHLRDALHQGEARKRCRADSGGDCVGRKMDCTRPVRKFY